jgi:hypothetical protein
VCNSRRDARHGFVPFNVVSKILHLRQVSCPASRHSSEEWLLKSDELMRLLPVTARYATLRQGLSWTAPPDPPMMQLGSFSRR